MPVVPEAPDPTVMHPIAGQPRVVFLRPLVQNPRIDVGEYTYYDHPDRAEDFEQDAVLYAFGRERLIIGRFCAIAAGVRFLLPGANHADRTAARASEALSLNVEDLDLPNRRAVIRGKNGELDYLHWQTGTGHLLARLVAGRPSGPVFLTDRRASPARAPAAVDLCPHTGRARLSYRRAQERFAEATGGWTLHQLRHSALTHLAEANVGLPLLMAKSRHSSLRSLQKYARPGVDAVAKLTAEHDPARRRR